MPFLLSANALCSLDEARAWLRRQNITDPSDDDLLTIAINGVSKNITKATDRQFFPETGVTKTFNYPGTGYLSFAPYEIRTITSIVLGGTNAAALTLNASTGYGDGDYFAMPRNKTPEGTYLYLTLLGFFKLRVPNAIYNSVLNERDVVVVGDWGMAAVPDDVKLACLIGVADFFRNPEQSARAGTQQFSVEEEPRNPGSNTALPNGALELLQPYIRQTAV